MRIGKRIALLVMVLFVFSIAAAGCGGGTETDDPAGDVIKVGVNVELSGGTASYGTNARDGRPAGNRTD
ncbi:MAG: hypothetical protein RQM92_00745 [Candidatus Syntrophopropionicum ammoniitolerans]